MPDSETEARYLTHDCDEHRVELVVDVDGAGNGDYYVGIVREGERIARLQACPGEDGLGPPALVRVTTSGERREHRGVAAAVRILHRAIMGEPPPSMLTARDSALTRALALPNFYRVDRFPAVNGMPERWSVGVLVDLPRAQIWGYGGTAEEAAQDLLNTLAKMKGERG